MSRVQRIVDGTTDLTVFRARAAVLSPRDTTGWLRLAAWAEEHALLTQAREAYDRVLAVDPENAAAHAALGHVRLGDAWLTREDAYRARGLVEFEGTWVTAAERQAILSERSSLAEQRTAIREAEARAREAEARAQAAESEARRAEAAARQAAEAPAGIPYPWVFGPGVVVGPPFLRSHISHGHRQSPPPPPVRIEPPQLRPEPPPSSSGQKAAPGALRAQQP
jgi:hypothetical protein